MFGDQLPRQNCEVLVGLISILYKSIKSLISIYITKKNNKGRSFNL